MQTLGDVSFGRRSSQGGVLLIVAFALWLAIFALMWGPYYVARVEGQLFLFPVFMVADAAVLVAAVIAMVLAIRSLVSGTPRPSTALAIVVGSALLIVVGPLLLWFGNVFDPSIY